MIYYFIIYLILIIGGFIFHFKYETRNGWFLLFITFVLIFTAAFRAVGVDNDMETYIRTAREGWGIAEPSFFIISKFSQEILHSIRSIFIIYAILGVVVKIYALKKLSPLFYLSLTFYFCLNYGVHEMNQIRLGVGAGFVLLLLYCKINKLAILKWIVCGSLATFFHFSLIVPCLVIVLLNNSDKNINMLIYLIPFSYLSYFLGVSIIDYIALFDGGYISDKIRFYQNFNIDIVQEVNVFNLMILIKVSIIFLIYSKKKLLENHLNGFYLYFKLYIIGLISLILLFPIPGAAFRLAETFWLIEPILLSILIYLFTPRCMALLSTGCLSLYFFLLNYISSGFLRPYKFDITI